MQTPTTSTTNQALPLNKYLQAQVVASGTAHALAATFVAAQVIIIMADTANTKNILFGCDTDCTVDVLQPGQSWRIDAPHLQRISLQDWYCKSADGSNQILKVLYA